MSDLFDPAKARERSLRQAFEDGVEEIYIGLFSLVMGAAYLVFFTLPKGSTAAQIGSFAGSFLQIALILTLVAIRKRVKATYVFPRTGYVVFRRGKWETWMVWLFGGVALTIALAATIWRSLLPALSSVAGPLFAAGWAGCFLWAGIAYKYPHMNWLAAFSLLVGIATYVAGAQAKGMLWVMLGVGMALALSGALRFRAFLKTRPIIEIHAIGEDHNA
jgi:hypothetical protein